ncbi:exopolysaccharide transport family protein [uncultured Nitratireductor sp.]|uniref:GumC family protein n=1 Tax=uncultured Nitratireductor sp. TaxID=520953 RepID=UPI0025EBCA68|nr:exopolysaccharide transport family protein [uncultured Nitratireductor sp.]
MVVQEIRKLTGTDMAPKEGRQHQDYISFRDIWAFLRRHFLVLALASAAGIAFGALYIAKTEATYPSIARIVIDREQARIASQDASTGTIIIETAEIASEVEIVKSEAIARSVIRQLNLTEDPEIQDSTSWRSTLRNGLTGLLSVFDPAGENDAAVAGEPDEEDIMRRTMAGFLGRVSVRRVGQSYVLEIGYTSTDPVKASRAANAIANTYMQSSLDAKSQIIARGAQWIEDRLVEVGRQAHEAALSAEEYRNRNDIAQVGTAGLDQQQLAEISSQLLAAQAETAGEAARLATINRMLAGQLPDSYVGEALSNTEINRLRSDLGAARTRLETLQARYGAQSEPTMAAKAEIERLEALINTELVRIQGVYKSNLDTAQAREALLKEQLDAIKGSVTEKNLARVELTELESRATTYRRMYESVLQQLITTLQKQSFPIGDARMVTAATPPLGKIWPKTTLIIPMSLMLGFAAGLGLAGLRDVLDRRISSGERLGRELGLPTLGNVPFTRFQAPGSKGALRFVLDAPYSGFSEALRGVKSSMDAAFPAGGPIVVGLTSVGGGEGKSTIAANLGQLYANEGLRVVLVDANFKKPLLSIQAANVGSKAGLAVYNGGQPHGDLSDEKRKGDKRASFEDMSILPVLTVEQIRKTAHPGHRFGHLPALKKKLEDLRQDFDVIIVDLSTFATSADTRAASAYLDGIMLVLGDRRKMTVEWLASALATFGKSRVGILGVVFNKRKTGQWWRPASGGGIDAGGHYAV